jgi:hypothetical protein
VSATTGRSRSSFTSDTTERKTSADVPPVAATVATATKCLLLTGECVELVACLCVGDRRRDELGEARETLLDSGWEAVSPRVARAMTVPQTRRRR